ncbi:sucrose nonfermenting 4-like protein isoform X1 [Cicer arietinum]|uniref:sucrose nonfermenting 4-like protein isoform X1 n=2 Tax=Cicer arietinum TaxID=3827 RepID=UPI003CC50C34
MNMNTNVKQPEFDWMDTIASSSNSMLPKTMEMFGSVGHGSGGVPEPSLIPQLFVWPYGGTTVFLSGSFTRWSTVIPMSPMECCPTAFQVTWNLTPGFHQYKFNVDGEWRHDEQQPFINVSVGTVNTIFVTQPSILPSNFNAGSLCNQKTAGTPTRSYMELEQNVPGHVEAFPGKLESDLHVSRYHLSTFMSSTTAYELLPKSGKVIALDIDLSVKQAFHILYEQGVSMAPVWDSSKGKFVGVLSAMDIIQIIKELGSHGFTLTEEQLEAHTIAAWSEEKLQQCGTDRNVRTYPWNFVDADPYESLKDIALKLLQNKVPAVPIAHPEDGSDPQLLHLTSLSEILKRICRYFKNSSSSLPILQLPIDSIPLGTWAPKVGEYNKLSLAMLRPNASVSTALSLMIQAEVSSIPIVNDNDSLLGIYSRSDITALAKDDLYARINLDKFSISQVISLFFSIIMGLYW